MTFRLSDEERRWVESATSQVEKFAQLLAPKLGLSLEDCRSAGFEAIVRAAPRYDPACGVPFAAFAYYRIRGAMIDQARHSGREVRRLRRATRSLESTQALLEDAEAQQPDPQTRDPRTLAERVQAAAALVARATTAVALAHMSPADPDSLATNSANAEALLLDEELKSILREEIAVAGVEQRDVLEAIYIRGLSMSEYARSVGKNKSTISRIHARALDQLSTRIRARLRRA